jgi:hypothetical protein
VVRFVNKNEEHSDWVDDSMVLISSNKNKDDDELPKS